MKQYDYSFPSGHSSFMASCWVSYAWLSVSTPDLAFKLPWWMHLLLGGLTLGTGISRMFLSLHFPRGERSLQRRVHSFLLRGMRSFCMSLLGLLLHIAYDFVVSCWTQLPFHVADIVCGWALAATTSYIWVKHIASRWAVCSPGVQMGITAASAVAVAAFCSWRTLEVTCAEF